MKWLSDRGPGNPVEVQEACGAGAMYDITTWEHGSILEVGPTEPGVRWAVRRIYGPPSETAQWARLVAERHNDAVQTSSLVEW